MNTKKINIIPTISFTNSNEEFTKMISNIIYSKAELVRCNVSKGAIEEYVDLINSVKYSYYKQTGKIFKILLDLPIPKDRVKINIASDIEKLNINEGDTVVLAEDGEKINCELEPVIYVKTGLKHHKNGEILIVGDGYLRLLVKKVGASYLECEALNTAYITSDVRIASKSGMIVQVENELFEKSIELTRIIKPECIALSYIENADDVENIKNIMKKRAGYIPDIMSKIENTVAIDKAEEIRNASTSVMIARGCLAVNVGAENLLKAQDEIVHRCKQTKEKIYIASNILKSFSSKAWPTRSDICDASYMVKSGIRNIVIIDSICKEYNFKYLCDSLEELGKVYA